MNITDLTMARSRYRGHFKTENLVFNTNLQEFAQRVTYISCLETNGKITAEDSYQQIKDLWKQLKQSYKGLAIEQNSAPNEDQPN